MSTDSKKVVWFEGMTLDPHHFQQWDRYREGVLSSRLQAVSPNGWGLTELQIDEERLANGELTLVSCTAIMPDGLYVNVPEMSPGPEARNVQEHLESTDETVRVHLAVPADRPDGRNVRLQGSDWERSPRFVAQSGTVSDENTGGNKRPVEVAHPNVQLRFATEPQQGYSTLPIAEVKRSAGGFRLSDDFVPTCLHMQASRRLVEMTQRLLELLVSKSSDLAEYKEEAIAQRELSPDDIVSLNLLGVINGFIPQLDHHDSSGMSHPADLFTTLTSLAGHLSTYVDTTTVRPRDLPTYDHTAPTKAFRRIEQVLRKMLGESGPTSDYQLLELSKKRENLLVTSADESLLTDSQLFLVTRSDTHPETQLNNALPDMLRVASPGTIEDVLQSYTQALRVDPTRRLPTNMPVDNQATYFKIQKRGPFWDSICEEEGIAIFVPSDFQDIELELIAVS